MGCLFCKIINGEIPSTKVFENDDVVAFLDIAPQAPVHIIVIPKHHIESMAYIDQTNSHLLAKIGESISTIAKEQKLNAGFRVITNAGKGAGQTVLHLHFHILSGKSLSEKIV